MQLYFIRHGQSVNNALFSKTGLSAGRFEDPELTELGIRQAEALARMVKTGSNRGGNPCDGKVEAGFGLTHLYTSLMLRAVQTGYFVAQALGLPLYGLYTLHERGGIYLEDVSGVPQGRPGKSREFFQKNYPGLVLPEDFIEAGWWNSMPQELPEAYAVRADKFLKDFRKKHDGTLDRVAVFSHAGFYNDVLLTLMHLPLDNAPWFTLFNTAVTRIDFHPDLQELVYQNRSDHLKPDMVT
jgi:2,3-bisphosphoglycerate-dependent phosphoglycerate mutase